MSDREKLSNSLVDLDLALEELQESRKKLVASWERANRASIEADGAMQSQHDTQKRDYAFEAAVIQSQIDRIDKLLDRFENLQRPENVGQVQIGHIVRIQVEDDEPMNVLLLEDLGGSVLSGIQLVSTQSPLGKAILGKKAGETVIYQGPAGEMVARIIAII